MRMNLEAAAVLVSSLLPSVFQLSGKGFLRQISTCSGSPCTSRPRLRPCPETKGCTSTRVMRLLRSPTPLRLSFQSWKTLGNKHLTLTQPEDFEIYCYSDFINKKHMFKTVFSPSDEGVWLKARTAAPDSSHTKTML